MLHIDQTSPQNHSHTFDAQRLINRFAWTEG